jgi:glycosyltransferase involved in cell wall biosynthesis
MINPASNPAVENDGQRPILEQKHSTSCELSTQPPIRSVIIATVPETLVAFMSHQIQLLNSHGFEVHTITSPGLDNFQSSQELNGIRHEVAMNRGMTPVRDVIALYRIWRILRQVRPVTVQTRTPKAGLLGMIAAWLARVPVRIYTIDGLPILTQNFLGKFVLSTTDFIACRLATNVLCVGRWVRRFVVANGLCSRRKIRVLGDGCLHGIDIDRFNPARFTPADRTRVRTQFGIPETAPLVCFVGRLVPDKGIAELASAWRSVRKACPEARLLLCGYFESAHPVRPDIVKALESDPSVHITGKWLSDMPPVYAAADLCVLPTYREGLSTVALEAGAMELPIVTTKVPGCVETVRDCVTGLLIAPKNAKRLAAALHQMIPDPKMRRRMGIAARQFVARHYSQDRISALFLEEYRRLAGSKSPLDSVQADRETQFGFSNANVPATLNEAASTSERS